MKLVFFFSLLASALRLSASDPVPGSAIDWSNRGSNLFKQGAYRQAEQFFVRARELAAWDGSVDSFQLSTILLNLAVVYRLEARYREAEPLYLETIRMREKMFGPNHAMLLAPLKGLTLHYLNSGKITDAERIGRQALAVQGKNVTSPIEEAEVLTNLALVLLAEGRYDVSEKLARQSLCLNPDSPERRRQLGEAWNILGRIYFQLIRYTAAEECFEKAASLVSNESRAGASFLASIWKNLADLEAARHNWSRGKELAEQSIALMEQIYGLHHPDVAAGYSTLASIECGLKHYARAERLYNQGLAIDTEILGDRSTRVAGDLSNLGSVAFHERHFDDAFSHFSQALERYNALLEPQSHEIGLVCGNLAQVYFKRHRFAEAEPLLEKAASIREKFYGPNDPTLADILSEYVVTLRSEGRYSEAALVEVRAGGIRVKNALRDSAEQARVQ